MNPILGRNFEAMDPLEWLARMADHIPDPGKHRTHFYALLREPDARQRRGQDRRARPWGGGDRGGEAKEAVLAKLGAAPLQGL